MTAEMAFLLGVMEGQFILQTGWYFPRGIQLPWETPASGKVREGNTQLPAQGAFLACSTKLGTLSLHPFLLCG